MLRASVWVFLSWAVGGLAGSAPTIPFAPAEHDAAPEHQRAFLARAPDGRGSEVTGALAASLPKPRRLQPAMSFWTGFDRDEQGPYGASTPSKPLRSRFNDDEADDVEGPDFWDVVVWIGAHIGRALRFILMGLGKLAYTVYVGISYGWQQGVQQHGEKTATR